MAWLSLDETDGDPAVFLADAAEALAVHRRPAALVLDDHERIAGTPGEESLWRFVAEAPSTLRIVLCGRVRPELPAGIAGDVLEIGPADLRMTDVEAAELLHRATGGSFAVREVMRQIELCEGRPAALLLVGNGGRATKQARAERSALPRPDRLRPNPVLTEPELAVLRLLSGGLSKREIGAELTLSFNTVHSHTKAIYRKLGVSSRHEAAARAHELGVG